ncbi:MAG: hypothetical protein Tsb009_39660 [Planctomycetaceae bacterium]
MTNPELNEHLVAWTARIAVGLYLLWLIVRIRQRGNASPANPQSSSRWLRILWTGGWAMLTIHTVVVFHVVHDWSHAAAFEHTAIRTEEVIGWHWGGGIYFNYALVAIWGADVLWRCLQSKPTSRIWTGMVHGFLAFMMFNATVVFGPRFWILIAVLLSVVLWMNRPGQVGPAKPDEAG